MASAAVATRSHRWIFLLHSPVNDCHCNHVFLMQILVWAAVVSIIWLPKLQLFPRYTRKSNHSLYGYHEKISVQVNFHLQLAYCSQVLSATPEARASLLILISPLGTWGHFLARTIEEVVLPLVLWMDLWFLSLPIGFSAPRLSSSFSGCQDCRLGESTFPGTKVLFLFPSLGVGVYSPYILLTRYC